MGSKQVQSSQEITDSDLDELFKYIDASLKGYPDRIHYKDVYASHVWTCHSRLFTFQINLKEEKLRYRFQICFFCKVPFRFKMRRSLTGKGFKILDSPGNTTGQLLAEKEVPVLIQKLLFYDSVEVSNNGVLGSKTFSGIAGLSEWPKTLGASITFVRFLLNYEGRKEATKQGEALCPYCRGMIAENERAVSCGECRTVHHQDCWNESDRCSVFGCGNKSELEL